MNRPRFLADEDLRGSIVRAVRRLAPEVEITTIVEEELSSVADAQVLEFAWQQNWIVVSHDINTMKAEAEQRLTRGDEIHGLLLASQQKSTVEIAESLILIAAASEFEEWHNRIVFLPI